MGTQTETKMIYSARHLILLLSCMGTSSGSSSQSKDSELPLMTEQLQCVLRRTPEVRDGFTLMLPQKHVEIGSIKGYYDSTNNEYYVPRIENYTVNAKKKVTFPKRILGVGAALMAAYLLSAHNARDTHPNCTRVVLDPGTLGYKGGYEYAGLLVWYSRFGFQMKRDGRMEISIDDLPQVDKMFYVKHGPSGVFHLVDNRLGKKDRVLCVVPQEHVGSLGGVDTRRCRCRDCSGSRRRLPCQTQSWHRYML